MTPWSRAKTVETSGATDDFDRYRLRNTATFSYNASGSHTTGNIDGFIVVPHDNSTGANDSSTFSKTAPGSLTTAPNTPLQVPYTFTVNTQRTGVPAASTKIVDYVDTRYFDIDAGLANVTVSGTYNRTGDGATVNLGAGDFDLVWDAATTRDAEGWTAQAVATGSGPQAGDHDCQTFTLNDRGVRSAENAGSGSTTDTCWR